MTALRVLAVSADDARHAPVRALLRGSQIEHVRTPDDALAALTTRCHDIVLVDREIDPPGTDGLPLAAKLVRAVPQVPVIVLSHAADRAADEEAAEAGIADFLLVPGLSADRLEHAIRYAITHQKTLQRLADSE
jgi:DNA-binding NtrC family response regulator